MCKIELPSRPVRYKAGVSCLGNRCAPREKFPPNFGRMLTLSTDGTSDQVFLQRYAERSRFSALAPVWADFFAEATSKSGARKNGGR